MLVTTHTFSAHTRSITSLKYSPNKKYIISCGADKRAVLHDAECFETIQQLELEHKGGINDFLWLNDRYIVSAADDATIRIFDIEQNKLCLMYRMSEAYPYCIAMNPENHVITVGDTEGGMHSYHIGVRDCIQKFTAHSSCVVSLQYSPDGGELITGSHDGMIRQWIPLQKPLCTRTIIPCPKVFTPLSSLSYSFNADYIFASTLDSTHRLYHRYHTGGDFTKPSHIKLYQGHQNEKYTLPSLLCSSSHNQQQLLLSGSENGLIHIWDVNQTNLLDSLQAHKKGVITALTTADSRNCTQIVSGGADGEIKVWKFRTDEVNSSSAESNELHEQTPTITRHDIHNSDSIDIDMVVNT